jgi:hypothetical protein
MRGHVSHQAVAAISQQTRDQVSTASGMPPSLKQGSSIGSVAVQPVSPAQPASLPVPHERQARHDPLGHTQRVPSHWVAGNRNGRLQGPTEQALQQCQWQSSR